MLKAIELNGFKSFAGKTRIEFRPGVTVVVGPNGSGKSNVVDAIKWVLGSQSAKSLRGKEMTDVIFNGSGSRGALQTAEVTLTLDNSEGLLEVAAPEVHLTRRVYRSGEAEYLLNRQPCRLRDIRDLLSGTGITTEAYSMIEQGKVDAVLQSSPRDRRIIFEEAAGISRFKAKRMDAGRRLERVEQNLLRLSDLVDEVESRLRSVRAQAGKAKRYRDHAGRLEELRTLLGLADWRKMTDRLSALEAQSAALQAEHNQQLAGVKSGEDELAELERQIEQAGNHLLEHEATATANREQTVAALAAASSGLAQCEDIRREISTARRQLAAMSMRANDAELTARDVEGKLCSARAEASSAEQRLLQTRDRLDAARVELERLRSVSEDMRRGGSAAAEKAAEHDRQLDVLRSQHSTAEAARLRCQERIQEIERELRGIDVQVQLSEKAEREAATELAKTESQLATAKERCAEQKRNFIRTQKKLYAVASELTRVRERVAVLAELENRREGYDVGVKEVLARRTAGEAPFDDVCGIVIDLFHVDVDTAPLIEVALGDKAQHLVVPSGDRLLSWWQAQPTHVSGRVGFLRLDIRVAASAVDRIDLSDESGVLGRADTFVQTEPTFLPLVRRLLGRTWLVDSMATAVRLGNTIGRGLNFLTADGEWLGADGVLVLGPRQAGPGILTRASELRAGQDQAVRLEQQIAGQTALLERLEQDVSRGDQELNVATQSHAEVLRTSSVAQHEANGVRSRQQQLIHQQEELKSELETAEGQVRSIDEDLMAVTGLRVEVEANLEQIRREAEEVASALPKQHQCVSELEQVAAESRVAGATCQQRVEILASQLAQFQRDQLEREQALADVGARLEELLARHQRVERDVLMAHQRVAALALEKERCSLQRRTTAAACTALKGRRSMVGRQLQQRRDQLGKLQGELGRIDVALTKLRHERETLWERLRDDYGIDITAAAAEKADLPPIENRRQLEKEIVELRDKLNSIGAVNLDALDELDALEERFQLLSGQYRDLVESKAALERIIQRINTDSRQLFVATLEAVRGHFQELFRRLFGGGEADIVLEEGDGDVLEGGIDIIARPPGKETRTISLLSGGEKTMTCVALLLAVFRSKPSPFCVLDEVDAALDEANIGRFTSVLREFLSSTQFIVVSHSKRTMVGADTLYGVTMQESGVSKLVSVRMEDVSEDGEIRRPDAGDIHGKSQENDAASSARRAA